MSSRRNTAGAGSPVFRNGWTIAPHAYQGKPEWGNRLTVTDASFDTAEFPGREKAPACDLDERRGLKRRLDVMS
jgi:hypothetical protein